MKERGSSAVRRFEVFGRREHGSRRLCEAYEPKHGTLLAYLARARRARRAGVNYARCLARPRAHATPDLRRGPIAATASVQIMANAVGTKIALLTVTA
jgi:hypothetical protein